MEDVDMSLEEQMLEWVREYLRKLAANGPVFHPIKKDDEK